MGGGGEDVTFDVCLYFFMVCVRYPVHYDFWVFFSSTLWHADAAKQWHCKGM